MNRELVVDIVERLPQGLLSRGWGWLARRKRPRPAVSLLQRTFVRITGIDLAEAGTRVGDYATLEDLFVRRLKPGSRRVDPEPSAVVSPVDGKVGATGIIDDGTLLQVKGRSYSLARLLDDAKEAKRYEGGPYATLYLAPHDYHRIHAPLSGEVREATLVPGRLMPVFPEALERVDELFAKNERLITYLDTKDAGRVAVIKVGATLVGRISVAYDDSVSTNIAGAARKKFRYDPAKPLNKGADLGAFELGSTVVLVGEAGKFTLDGLSLGDKVRMGQRIGTVTGRKAKKKVEAAKRTKKSRVALED